tara:strand:+ start:885 stop:1985 length:1101 start_codon:yes stop_codon:yes gene_type:complete
MHHTFIVSHSAGELDVILPIIVDLSKKKTSKVNIIITKKEIFNSIKINNIYQKILNSKNISYKYTPLLNKFDHGKFNFFLRLIYKFILSCLFLIKNLNILRSDHIYIETTNQISKDLIFYILNNIFKKKFYILNQGQSYNIVNDNFKLNPTKPINYEYLIFSKKHIEWCKSLGYKKYKIIGFPKFFLNWIKEISKYDNFRKKNNYVIFSRPPHKFYMSKKNYKYLLNSSLETILKIDATANIYIKPHPRETFDLFKRNMKKEYINNKNIKFTNLNSMTLSKNAKLIISFWTSAILESIIFNKPAIEYHIENKNFKKIEPRGSLYKLLGFTTVRNKKDLLYFITHPKKIKKINKNSFEEFNFKKFKI